ncbi:MAG TPA: hypothetical protein VG867_04990, partial [Rhizomicrobium sp.]|nr:hypothetical protein [Rhizomicrobium sp.]
GYPAKQQRPVRARAKLELFVHFRVLLKQKLSWPAKAGHPVGARFSLSSRANISASLRAKFFPRRAAEAPSRTPMEPKRFHLGGPLLRAMTVLGLMDEAKKAENPPGFRRA